MVSRLWEWIRSTVVLTLTQKVAVLLLFISVVPLAALGMMSYRQSLSSIEERLGGDMRALMVEKQAYLELFMRDVEALLTNLASLQDIQQVLRDHPSFQTSGSDYERLATQAKIGYILSGYASLVGLVAIDLFSTGDAHYHVGETLDIQEIRVDLRARLFRQVVNSERGLVWAGIEDNVIVRSRFPKVITVLKAIKALDTTTATERPLGFLLLSYDPATFSESFHRHGQEGHWFRLVDTASRIVYDPNPAKIGSLLRPDLVGQLGRATGPFLANIDGTAVTLFSDRSNPHGWTLLGAIPVARVTAEVATIRHNTLLLLGGCLVLAVIFSAVVSRRVVAPIIRITDRFREIQHGKPTLAMQLPVSSRDEIGNLILWFNAFVENLVEKRRTEEALLDSQQQLQRSHEALERRVEERTRDLILANEALRKEIVERQRAQEERATLQNHLRQSQKMEAIGKLAGGVAHDFNNLLMVIILCGELLREQLRASQSERGMVEEILRAADRASMLTRQLLAFSRKQVLVPKILDLNALVKSLESMLRRLIGEDIHLVIVTTAERPTVRADPNQIEQAIVNLAVNARDAMPTGGSLTIETAIVTQTDRFVRLTVADTGVGMTADVAEHLFEPFFTTKERGKGTGLGLSTVYGIVTQSGGRIEVATEAGRGTAFHLFFPLVQEAVAPDEPTALRAAAESATESVLVVEDEDTVRNLVARILSSAGYQVLTAASGEDALRILAFEMTRPVHVVLSDVVMPGMSGLALARQVATLRPMTRIILMSGHTDHTQLDEAALDPAWAFLQKPVAPAHLLRVVRQILSGSAPAPGGTPKS